MFIVSTSETLDEMIRFHITTSALRSIDKAGGLDNYLLTSRHVTSGEGLAVKNRILEKRRQDEELQTASEEQLTESAGQSVETETEAPRN